MPGTRYSEAALDRRREKLEYTSAFPGLLVDWRDADGKILERSVPVGENRVLLFTDGTFLVAREGQFGRDTLLLVIEAVRQWLVDEHADALAELDRRIDREKEAMRLARMEKVLGAVETNLPQVPELRDELLRLLERF